MLSGEAGEPQRKKDREEVQRMKKLGLVAVYHNCNRPDGRMCVEFRPKREWEPKFARVEDHVK
jgi:hypothetical protein